MIRVLSALVLCATLACGGAEESDPAAAEAAPAAEEPALELEAPVLEMEAPALEAPAEEPAPMEESDPAEAAEGSEDASDADGMGGMGGSDEAAEMPAAWQEPGSASAPLADSDGSLRGDAAAGAQIYALYCATCHGQGGKGDGPAAPKNPPPADHTDPVRMGGMTDEDMYTVIDKGGAAIGKSPLMASWGPIVQEQGVKDLIAFIRQLSGT